MNNIIIRLATLDDAAAILEIYVPYVKNTPISFEYAPPSLSEFQGRMTGMLGKFPYLVCEVNGVICGYAYASTFRARPAYQWDVELSIYLHADWFGKGVSRMLYERVFRLLALQGYRSAYACITYPNSQSVRFHQHMGFINIGIFPKCGYKLGQWRDVLWMVKLLGEFDTEPFAPYPLSALPSEVVLENLKINCSAT